MPGKHPHLSLEMTAEDGVLEAILLRTYTIGRKPCGWDPSVSQAFQTCYAAVYLKLVTQQSTVPCRTRVKVSLVPSSGHWSAFVAGHLTVDRQESFPSNNLAA